jgi:uncharacterized membrane protein required for colicin V production
MLIMAYDVVVAGILLFCAWRGASKGILWQLASIAGIVVCFVFAETVSIAVSPYLGIDAPLNRWVAIFGLYVVSSLVCFGIARGLRGGLEKISFDGVDRHFGMIFGAIKGAILVMVVTFFAVTLREDTREMVFHSNSGYYIAILFQNIEPVLPEELNVILADFEKEFRPENIAEHKKLHPKTTNSAPATPPLTPNGSSSGQYGSMTQVDQLMSQLPNLFGPEMNNMVKQAVANTKPEDRAELMTKLQNSAPGVIQQVASEWLNGKPVSQQTDAYSQKFDQLAKEIAAMHSKWPGQQAAYVEQIELTLSSVPKEVSVAILDDWHADLTNRKPDPDPNTTANTQLDQRIAYQIARARVAVGSLDDELKNRVMGFLKR